MKRIFLKTYLLLVVSMCIFSTTYAEEIRVVPIGKTVGVKLYTDGLIVIGSSEINGRNIAKEYGIEINDRIISVNNKNIDTTEDFSKIINESPDGVRLSILRDNESLTIDAVPEPSSDEIYRLGLWVRDSTAGIGTVTYYNPSDRTFAALGHGINDIDTGNILSVKSGNILHCDILSVTKSKKGIPGEITASFSGESIGNIAANSHLGIFGKMSCDEYNDCGNALPVAAKSQIQEGDAYIITDAFGGKQEQYSIKIKKITDNTDKALIIEITDNRLIEQSGGIVQGMSGSPIIQNDRLVGAVTHVFINNPLKGYGALAENMIDISNRTIE